MEEFYEVLTAARHCNMVFDVIRLQPTQNESLIGDLTEEYARGRSRLWYWWQVVVALVAGLFQEVRTHKALAARALITGWFFVSLFALLLPWAYRFLRELLPPSWFTI